MREREREGGKYIGGGVTILDKAISKWGSVVEMIGEGTCLDRKHMVSELPQTLEGAVCLHAKIKMYYEN